VSSIRETRFGTWEVRWRENGRPKASNRKTKADAVDFQREVDRRLEGRKAVMRSKDVPTLEGFAAEWMASRQDLERSTRKKYLEFLEVHILPTLGHLSLVDLRPRRLAEWQKERLDDGAGPAVLGKAQALLGQILKRAVLPYEYLDTNPILALEKPAYEKREQRWLSAADVELMRMWYLEREDVASATLISALAYIGLRPQNVLARLWGDLQQSPPRWVRTGTEGGGALQVTTRVSDGVIRGGTKTDPDQKNLVYVPKIVLADFAELRLSATGASGDLIWSRAKDGRPWTKSDWDNWRWRKIKKGKRGGLWDVKSFKTAASKVGLGSSLTPYALRHTAASLYASVGWTHVEIAHQLQHSPETSLREYQHLIHEAPTGRSIEDYIREARGLARERCGFSVGSLESRARASRP
jgi:integrase